MDFKAQELLREIGSDLDHHEFPCVYSGGFVMPGKATDLTLTPGQETNNERKRRSETGPWQRPARRQGASRQTAPVICASLQDQYETELDAVQEAYPGTKTWHQKEGLWLLTESALLLGLGKKVTFLTAIPYNSNLPAKGWGFWTTAIYTQWIGPRHTNFPDGSICAFEPEDQTWMIGRRLTNLLDLFSLWALRHLHLGEIGRWPGRQSVHYAYERLTELRDDEFCGCENSDKLYKDCCKTKDLALDREAIKKDFLKWSGGGFRNPPEKILNSIIRREDPPPVLSVFP